MPQNKTDPFDLDDPEILAEPVKPEAAIEFWRQKSLMTKEEAMRLAEGERWRAFWVSGLYRHDQIQCVYDAIGKALENGETIEDFKKRIASVIESQGWKGYRIETIFRTNIQQAYSAGRYAKMQSVKSSRPYWQYLAIMDKRVRPSHAILHGKVYPADHEFWNFNFPPNGFRCRCGIATLSERQVKAQGLTVEKDMPQVPVADLGWRNNTGRDWIASLCEAAVAKLENSPPELAGATVRVLVKGGFEYWSGNPRGNFPLCVLKKADAESIGARGTVAVISAETMKKQQDHHPELTPEDYAKAQEAVENGEKIRQDERNIAFVLDMGGGVVVIVKATRDGNELYVTSLRRMSADEEKRADLMRRLKMRQSKKADGGA